MRNRPLETEREEKNITKSRHLGYLEGHISKQTYQATLTYC
jgi:hypothetical protein